MADVESSGPFPKHEPLGSGVGIHPGRVAWIHRPEAVRWDGTDFWWRPGNFNPPLVLGMIRSGLQILTGAANPGEAWHRLVEYKTASPYQPGRKFAIKVNMNGSGEYYNNTDGLVGSAYGNPVVLKCLLQSMVEDGRIRPRDITVYDAGRIFPDYMREMCGEGELAGVQFRYRDASGANSAQADPEAQISWSQPVQGAPCWLPLCVTQADYLINLASLKGHSWGMTLAAKNHFGSFVNEDLMRSPQAAGLHGNIVGARMGSWSALTDLLALLGDKTILWMLDALITAPSETGSITLEKATWQMPPFDGGLAASLFLSQDPVALDSVGADFLTSEPVMARFNPGLKSNSGMENYLHEAALLPNPPSGVRYGAPDYTPVSLGVHEHWNNAEDKQYSRNLGKNEGIELVRSQG